MNRDERRELLASIHDLALDDPELGEVVARVASTEKHAGSAIEGTYNAARLKLLQAKGDLDQLMGYLHYRLWGQGARGDITGEKILTPDQERDAKAYHKELEDMKRDVEGVAKSLRKLERTTKEMDAVLQFS